MPLKDPVSRAAYQHAWRTARSTMGSSGERFMALVEQNEGGCWLWKGQLNNQGYGRLRRLGYRWMAHRFSYIMFKGAIPEGLVVDHLCKVRRCVNPDHLEAVTQAVNCQRGDTGKATGARNRAKTHCPHGHLLDGVRPNGERYCKTCNRERERRRSLAKKGNP